MKKQKFLSAALAAFIAAGLLAGCTDSGGNSETESGAAVQDSTETTAAAEEVSKAAKVSVDGTKFIVDGKELWINGVNTPWIYWNEFGSPNFDEAAWDSHFADLHDIGVNASRVWINCNSMIGIKLKTTGEVKEVTEKHWQDVDKLFEIAEKHGVYIMPTLLSFDHFKDTNYADRWRAIITDDTAMQSYIDNYLKPFVERYGGSPYLLGIDLMNEPDWVYENEECGKLPLEQLSNFFAKCTAAVHEADPEVLVTVGVGMIKYNSDQSSCVYNFVSDEIMKGFGGDNACLDFYSLHYYDWMKPNWGVAFEKSPTDYGLDGTKPVFLGEIGTATSLVDVYQKCYDLGWNGVMMWTSNSQQQGHETEHADNWDDLAAAVGNIKSIAPEKVFPLGE
ncbi:MAG: cellulase family glycosylhydrolase [Ruminococcus sp.]|nr:cellulase family glycosylhydrolase [Ruminococcus sp.]MCM1382176.1 cellulase family glycosylhydrolase [Muribaculaceae bacterium]MCM1480130.1 cellulase family glycosylhydrolase [Muribaculaceae bacterium]